MVFGCVKKIKQDPQTSNIPVIFLSDHNNVESRLRGFRAGGGGYISKPFQSAEVGATINTLIKLNRKETLLRHQNKILEQAVLNVPLNCGWT